MKTHRRIMIAALCVLGMYGNGNAQIRNEEVYEFPNLNEQNYRYHINIPDIDGYKTLKCDFHVHTVFPMAKYGPTNG